MFCNVLSSVQFISDLVTSDAPSHTLASYHPWSQLWSLFVLASYEVLNTSCMFLYVSYMIIFSVFLEFIDFIFSAKSVKIAVIEPGLALAEKGHQVTVVCPIKAKKEVGYGKSLGGFL